MAYKRKYPKEIPANNLASERVKRFWTQVELAFKVREKTGVPLTPSTISKIECSEVEPRAITKQALAVTLEVDVTDLFPLPELAGVA